jgi:two-component system, OmpR family, sensor histidine kinase BaeS
VTGASPVSPATPAVSGAAPGSGRSRRGWGGRRRGAGAGLTARVLVGLLLVVATGVVTAWLVASAVAPSVFHEHMMMAGEASHSAAVRHAEAAFDAASGISLLVGLLSALVASVAVSGYLARRLARSLHPLVVAAAQVAGGRYDTRVVRPRLGAEVDGVAAAFNQMAGELQRVEQTRRRLLDDLAHELRTPVATLSAYLEALEDGVTALDGETLSVMQAQTRRLARLAQDVSAVSRAEEGHDGVELRRTAVTDLLAGATAAAADRYAAKDVHLHVRAGPGLPPVQVDGDRMGQVLGNLLDNALRYTASGGNVTMAATRQPHGVRIVVADDGEGVAAEHLPHLFERFYRADAARDRDHGGSGIGLAIVRALVEAHGGRVAVASLGPGHGTTVTIDLPAAHG